MSLALTPLRLPQVDLPNRIAVPAMVTRLAGEDGHVNDAIIDRYSRFAEGGAGLIVGEATTGFLLSLAVPGGLPDPFLNDFLTQV
ncbi:MAG: hypothetical protein ACE5GB_11165, partial [Acidimicrobiales bacterium]